MDTPFIFSRLYLYTLEDTVCGGVFLKSGGFKRKSTFNGITTVISLLLLLLIENDS